MSQLVCAGFEGGGEGRGRGGGGEGEGEGEGDCNNYPDFILFVAVGIVTCAAHL